MKTKYTLLVLLLIVKSTIMVKMKMKL